ncbi:WYL domain-containing protein [Clostridiaceae bacterium]|nr:WYL domain-containing protein [Clostridiaceae bacterium]
MAGGSRQAEQTLITCVERGGGAVKWAKSSRTLDLYARLCEGRRINKREEARRFGVDERSIQRDIDDIRDFLAERAVSERGDRREILYDRSSGGFIMAGSEDCLMSNSEALAVAEILLESRAFTKKELGRILGKMIAGCVPQQNQRIASDLISNEMHHYVELEHGSPVLDKLWEIGKAIRQNHLLELSYQKQSADGEIVKRIVQPAALMFSEYYFYLNAFMIETDEHGRYARKYAYPTIYRIDRIRAYREMKGKVNTVYADRFEEGEFRKRVQFMYPGALVKLQFCYTGKSIEAILDRLPTARVLEGGGDAAGYVVEAEVYGNGILMWLLSQGSAVEVLRPESVRREMKRILTEMLGKYGKMS